MINLENCTYRFLNNEEEIKTSMIFLKSLVNKQLNEIHHKTILWSENMYQTCLSNINFLSFDKENEKQLTKRIVTKINQKVSCEVITQEGLMDPEIAVLIILIDKIELRESLFCKFFDFGTAYCSMIDTEMKILTIIVLALVTHRKEVNHSRINLNHPLFNDISYKLDIVCQDFTFDNANQTVTATFTLSNGDIKNEVVKLLNN